MNSPILTPKPGYIAYIDEAGDDGLTRIKTGSERGASQWMVMAAIVVKAAREPEVLQWVKAMMDQLGQRQLTHIHFRDLSLEKKRLVCSELAARSLRIFVLLSHKKNMEGYHNIRAEKAKVRRRGSFVG